MKRWRLRTRLILWSACATGLALLTLVGMVAHHFYSEQVDMIDVRLETNARILFARRTAANAIDRDVVGSLLTSRRGRDEPALHGFLLIRSQDGKVLQAEPSELAALAQRWPLRRRTFSGDEHGKPLRFEGLTRGGDVERLRFGVFKNDDVSLVLAAPLEPAEDSVNDLLAAALIAIPAVLLVVAGGSWWIARRALQPIAAITEAAAAITADRLEARLPVPVADDEIGRHTRVLNAMFDRLQRGFEQATRFTADASHELRTPLTILRGEIEEALRTGPTTPEQEKLLVSLLEQTGTLQKISANLLLLARFDAGKVPLERAELDFSLLATEALEDAELLAAPTDISVTAQLLPDLHVNGDAVLLRRVLLNLVDNAVRYNRPGGSLQLGLAREKDRVVFSISNTGSGIPAEKHRELFQRFFRLDPDRNRIAGGSGLGLSLCREIVTAHGGEMVLRRSDSSATEFAVFLPLAKVAVG